MATSVPHSDISLAPSTPRRATFECIYAGMRVRCSFSTFFFLFYSFWMDEHLFTGHARVEHESSRGCFPPMIVIPFDTALNTNLTANWNTRNERAQKWRRDLLFRLFSNVRSAWSAHVYRAADSVVGCFSFCGGIMLNI